MKKIFLITAVALAAASQVIALTMQNNYLGLNVNNAASYGNPEFYDFAYNLGTSNVYSPSNAALLFGYSSAYPNDAWTSRIVMNVNGTPIDLENSVPVTPLSMSGGDITGSRKFGSAVQADFDWKFVLNPVTGIRNDTLELKIKATNISASVTTVALRAVLDTQVILSDGANISVDNGITVVSNNTVWTRPNVPQNWWDFDVNPHITTPALVGRGYNKNNVYGDPVSEPDVFEVAHWPDTVTTTANIGYWQLATPGDPIGDDSAVVLWFTDGNGGGINADTVLLPNQSKTWVIYYGLNQEQLLTTPTITVTATPTLTISPVFSPTSTPTVTVSSTITPSHTITLTFTQSPTVTSTLTPSSTPSISPTLTGTPTLTATETITVTFTATATKTITLTVTITMTSTISCTPTTSYTSTSSATVTQTFTVTPTCTATPLPLTIADQGPFPNPFRDDTNIVYWISADADVDVKIYTVSGEVVYWEEDPERKLKGYNKFYWNGKNKGLRKVASGVYIYRISAVSDRGEHVRVFGKTACVR